jgi:hypothetical protein
MTDMMNDMTKATARPWRVSRRLVRTGRKVVDAGWDIHGADTDNVALVLDDGAGREPLWTAEAKANAALIVRAVNAHDDLIAVLADILECEDEGQPIEHSIVARARAALALARGEG